MAEITREEMFVRNTVQSLLSSRAGLARQLDGPGRNLNADCGYPHTIDINHYQAMYEREGVAARVVGLYPQECWQEDPEIYEDEDESINTPFEKGFKDFAEAQNIYHYWERLDEQCGIGSIGGMLLGVNDGKDLSLPLEGVDEFGQMVPRSKSGNKGLVPYSYTRVLSESFMRVASWVQDDKNPRFGQPLTYDIRVMSTLSPNVMATGEPTWKSNVHWSRIIPLADGYQCSEIYGTPRMQSLYNRLCDIRKLLGGSAEMFWKGAFPGVSFEMDPRITAADATLDPVAVRKEFEAYTLGLQRFLATEGLHANSLSVQVADPASHLMVQMQAISIAMGCPLRVLIGSEAAQLASAQDTKRWNGRLSRRQKRHLTPREIRPTVDRLIACGVLPPPGGDGTYTTKWPDLNTPTDGEKADVALKITQAMASYSSSGAETIMPPLEWWTMVIGLTQEEAQQVIDSANSAEELMTEIPIPIDPNKLPPEPPKPGFPKESP